MIARQVRLDDIADIKTGDPAPQPPDAFADDGPMFVRMQDVGRDHITPELATSTDRLSSNWLRTNRLRLFPKNSILIPKSGASVNLNHRAKLAEDAYVVSHLAVVIPDPQFVDPEYLFWWSVKYDPRRQVQVTSLPSLKTSMLKEAMVPLPPLEEQRRIVDILNRAASIERLRARASTQLRALIPALFIKMFGDDHQIADRFEMRPLKEVSSIGSGATKGRKIEPEDSTEVPYLRVANVQDGFLNLDEIKTIIIRSGEEAKYALEPGDLVMTEGGDPDKLGRAAIWAGQLPYCAHQNHVFRVRPDTDQVLSDYLRAFVGSTYGKAYFLRVAKQTTGIASINKTQLGNFPVAVPPMELQERFTALVDRINAADRLLEKSASEARSLSQALMARLFEPGQDAGATLEPQPEHAAE
ncbi:MAG: restriction endonuclease subunit S [Pseudooceanicola sp.]